MRLLPWIEDDIAERAIRQICPDQPPDRIIPQDRRYAPFNQFGLLLVLERAAEERLLLFDGVALVIEDRAASPHPAWLRVCHGQLALGIVHKGATWISLRCRARFGLY